jgi:hypothetical protein
LAFVQPGQAYDFVTQLEIAKKEIETYGLGIGDNQRGLMSSGRHTKYETQVAEGYYDQAMWPRRRVIQKAILDVLYNWSKMIFDFWLEPRQVRTYDAAGRAVTVEFKGADLRGDYKFTVSLDSMRSKGHAERIEEANMMLYQSMPFTQMGIINPEGLYRQWATRMDSDWDIEALLPQAQPQAGGPVPFEQYQQQFMQQASQQPQAMDALLQMQGGMPPVQ